MTAAQFERLDEVEAEGILRWRFSALARAGYERRDRGAPGRAGADRPAPGVRPRRGGLPPETAARILL